MKIFRYFYIKAKVHTDLGWSIGRGIGIDNGANGLRYWPGSTTDSPVDGTIWYPAMGYRDGSGLNNVSSYGYYWSAAPNSSTGGYYLGFGSTSVNPGNTGSRYSGFAARCVAE